MNIWDKVFESGLKEFFGRQPLKNLLSPLLNALFHLSKDLIEYKYVVLKNSIFDEKVLNTPLIL